VANPHAVFQPLGEALQAVGPAGLLGRVAPLQELDEIQNLVDLRLGQDLELAHDALTKNVVHAPLQDAANQMWVRGLPYALPRLVVAGACCLRLASASGPRTGNAAEPNHGTYGLSATQGRRVAGCNARRIRRMAPHDRGPACGSGHGSQRPVPGDPDRPLLPRPGRSR